MFNSVDEVSILSAQVEALRRKIDYFNASNMYVQNIICDYCGGEHAYSDCPIDNWFYTSSKQTNPSPFLFPSSFKTLVILP